MHGKPQKVDCVRLASNLSGSRNFSAELHRSSLFTTASAESNGHDRSSENDSALHSLSPDSIPIRDRID